MNIPKDLPTKIQEVLKRVEKTIEENTTNKENEYKKCPLCNDSGFIYNSKYKRYLRCKCQESKNINRVLRKLEVEQINKTFRNFNADNEITKTMKNTTTNYYLSFEKNIMKNNNSFALLGKIKGKTHLVCALVNNFIFEKEKDIEYISPKNIRYIFNNSIEHTRYKEVEILVIDDLFKNKYSEIETNILLDLFNYRSKRNMPIIITSQYTLNEILNINEKLGCIIKAITQNYIYEFETNKKVDTSINLYQLN